MPKMDQEIPGIANQPETASETRAAPRSRLKLNTTADVAREFRKLYRDARAQKIALSDAEKLGVLLSSLANIISDAEAQSGKAD